MSISSATNRNDYTGNGATSTYNYTFRIFEDSDLTVIVRDTAGAETTLVITTDYTVTGAGGASGGTIVLVDNGQAWLDGDGDLLTDYALTIRRVLPLIQETDIRNQGAFYPEIHEDQFDKLIMIEQQQGDDIARSLKLPQTVSSSVFSPELPATLPDNAGATIIVNATGDAFEIGPTSDEISNAQAQATAAAASATDASEHATTASRWAKYTAGTVIDADTSVDSGEYSAKEYAQGAQASTGGSSKSWAQVTGADVTGAAANSRSAKSWAQDANTGATLGGSAKDWAQNTSVPVDGSSGYSAKEHALGTQTRGAAGGGSAKDWANYTGGTVDDTEYSAKKYSQDSAASAADAATYAAAALWNDVVYKVFGDSPVSIVQADSGKLISVDCTGGNVVINLPSIAALDLTGPWAMGIIKTDSSANTVTVNPNGAETIEGSASYVLSVQKQGVTLIPDTDKTPDQWAALQFGSVTTLYSPTIYTPSTDIITLDGQASTPANPSAGNYKAYISDTTGKLTILDSAGTETTVGAGAGGINYITNGDAEAGTTGWSTYADAAATSPVDGTGGSATITISASSSSPLRGTKSFVIAKDAANRQGEGVSYPFTIDAADKGRVLKIQFDYNTSANYVDDDVRLYVYDITNSRLIEPAPNKVKKADSSVNTQIQPFEFQTSIDSTSYRLIVHIAGTTATAWDLKLDNITVGPSAASTGPFISDWQSYTPTGTWVANTTYTGKWRRVGDQAEYQLTAVTSGAPTAANLAFNLPSGHTIDTTKLALGTNDTFTNSTGVIRDSGVTAYLAVPYYTSTTSVQARVIGSASTYGDLPNVTATVPITFGASDSVQLNFSVPIVGWSSNQKLSSDAERRVVALKAYNSASQTGLNNTDVTVQFNTKVIDTHGAFNTGTYTFTAPVGGLYKAFARVRFQNLTASTTYARVRILKNGSTSSEAYLYASNTETTVENTDTLSLVTGDTVTVTAGSNDTSFDVVTSSSQTLFQMNLLQGPEQIAASETVAARVYLSANQTGVNTNNSVVKVNINSRDFDTTNSWDTSAYRYNVPVSGKYKITTNISQLGGTNALAAQYQGILYKTGSPVLYFDSRTPSAAGQAFILVGGTTLNLVVGDYIELYIYGQGNNSASTYSISGGTSNTSLDIVRIGN